MQNFPKNQCIDCIGVISLSYHLALHISAPTCVLLFCFVWGISGHLQVVRSRPYKNMHRQIEQRSKRTGRSARFIRGAQRCGLHSVNAMKQTNRKWHFIFLIHWFVLLKTAPSFHSHPRSLVTDAVSLYRSLSVSWLWVREEGPNLNSVFTNSNQQILHIMP